MWQTVDRISNFALISQISPKVINYKYILNSDSSALLQDNVFTSRVNEYNINHNVKRKMKKYIDNRKHTTDYVQH